MSKKYRILVTGGAGTVGAKLVNILQRSGHSVLSCDLSHQENEIGIALRTDVKDPDYLRCDIREFRQLERMFEKFGPFDYVYHCAAEFGRWNGEDFYENVWNTNAVGTKHIIRLQERLGFKLIHFSSSEVYGDWPGVMRESIMDENEVKQLNDYALSKWVNEQQIRNSATQYKTQTVVVRLFNTYGPGEYYSPYRSVNCRFLYCALKGIPWVVFRGHTRTSTYIDDTITTLANIVKNFIPGETYNIGGSTRHTIEELSDLIIDITGADKSLVTYKDSEILTTKDKIVDCSKSVKDLDHKNTISLEDGIDITARWMKKHILSVKKILHVVGARPNFPKVAPIMAEMNKFPKEFEQVLVHTGQHYDYKMSEVFFEDLGLPTPNDMLNVGAETHAVQTANIMTAFEPVLLKHNPDLVMLVGDVNSTMACALVCSKLGIKTAHVEAGLRSFDRTMPEEINRIITDHLCDILFTPSFDADANLYDEGIKRYKIHRVGNVMIDTLVKMLPKTESKIFDGNYILVTLHRPSNVDDKETLAKIIHTLDNLGNGLRVIFPIHPRTRKRIEDNKINCNVNFIEFIEPMGYIDFIRAMRHAKLVVTDSGGVQEETCYLSVPCLTLRPNTERPITISSGTNELVEDVSKLGYIINDCLSTEGNSKTEVSLWDGKTSERIVEILRKI